MKKLRAVGKKIAIVFLVIAACVFVLCGCGGGSQVDNPTPTPTPPEETDPPVVNPPVVDPPEVDPPDEPDPPTPPTPITGDPDLFLCLTENVEQDAQKNITVSGLSAIVPTTLADIPVQTAGIGDKSDRTAQTYFAFSFYLVNKSETEVGYDMEIAIEDYSGNILNALRVLVKEGEGDIRQGSKIYAQPESSQAGIDQLAEKTDYTTQSFVSDQTVCVQSKDSFAVNTNVKFTVVIWLEGNDIDCTNDICGDRVSFSIGFAAKE